MKAPLVARATDRQCSNISSTSTSLVSSMPSATMARLSPTRIISMPAVSATRALGKSWAVIIVIGSFFLYRDRRVPMVTFLRGLAGGGPSGECELCLVCRNGRRGQAARLVGRVRRVIEAHDRARLLVRYIGTCEP